MMHPLPLMESVFHHTYNNDESSAIRARIMDLEQKLKSLAEKRRGVTSLDELVIVESAIKDLKERFEEEKSNWKNISWAMEVRRVLVLFASFLPSPFTLSSLLQ